MFLTCPSVAASLLLVPGATLTIRRRALFVPTETVSATFASEPLPIATDRALFATAPCPNASAEVALPAHWSVLFSILWSLLEWWSLDRLLSPAFRGFGRL